MDIFEYLVDEPFDLFVSEKTEKKKYYKRRGKKFKSK